jgi:hypothetical protein
MTLAISTLSVLLTCPFFWDMAVLLGDWCLMIQSSMAVSSQRVKTLSTNHSVKRHHIQGQWRPQIHCGEGIAYLNWKQSETEAALA